MQRSNVYIMFGLLLAIILAILPTQAIHAQGNGFLIFDLGKDGEAIDLPGIDFQNINGDPWVYGDIRTKQYNAPYPSDCSDRPGAAAHAVCDFAVNNTGFAWPGMLGSTAQFTFTEGGATYVEVGISTATPIQLIATGDNGRVIDANAIAANTKTGRLDRVRLTAAAGQLITKVVIHSSANFWLIDDLATDAPGVPNQLTSVRKAAQVIATQWVQSINDSYLGRLATYTIVITNQGDGDALDTLVTMNIDPQLELIDVSFDSPRAWVTTIANGVLTIKTGRLASHNGKVVATIRMRMHTIIPDNGVLGSRISYEWYDQSAGGRGFSNLPSIIILMPDTPPQLALNITLQADSVIKLQSDRFVPNEPVAIWYEHANQTNAAGRVIANNQGEVSFSFKATTAGNYHLVAYGIWSGIAVVGDIIVQ